MNDISVDIFEYEFPKVVVATVARQSQLQTRKQLAAIWKGCVQVIIKWNGMEWNGILFNYTRTYIYSRNDITAMEKKTIAEFVDIHINFADSNNI